MYTIKQNEAKIIICDQLYKTDHGYHRCNDKDYEEYIGWDVFNITDEFDDYCKKTEYLPCEKCELLYDDYDGMK